jgi:hypothetical protein
MNYFEVGIKFSGNRRVVIEDLSTAPFSAWLLNYFEVGIEFLRQRASRH